MNTRLAHPLNVVAIKRGVKSCQEVKCQKRPHHEKRPNKVTMNGETIDIDTERRPMKSDKNQGSQKNFADRSEKKNQIIFERII
jgi:hypothetical protein